MTASWQRPPAITFAADDLTPAERPGPSLSTVEIAAALGAGRAVSDRAFDRFLPEELARVSRVYWTPVAVAARAARWLDDLGVKTVLDIGSGAGKFCVTAALAGRSRFRGLEQRGRLVRTARVLARRFGVEKRVRFVKGDVGARPPLPAEAYYLYNPFGENLFGPDEHLDTEVELNRERYERDVAEVEGLLHDARVGTYVITYNGFGGRVPDTYKEVRVDRSLPNLLKMWQKYTSVRPSRRGGGTLASSE